MDEPTSEIVIGIDLGTTNSMAAYVHPGGVEIVEGEVGGKPATSHTPSVITLLEDKNLIGQEALSYRLQDPHNTIYSFKRFMGRGMADLHEDLKSLPFAVNTGERENILLGKTRKLSPEELSAMILTEVKTRAEQILGKKISKAVITVPAYFDDAQRQATRDACEIAGLEVLRILNEPTAAAIAYGLEEGQKGKILVYDFGGGTFDVSVLELKGKIFQVLSTHGDTHLGGDDLDQILTNWASQKLFKENAVLSSETRQLLKKITEELKITLTNNLEVEVEVDIPEMGVHQNLSLTRDTFDQLIEPKVKETLEHINEALQNADLTPSDIDEVVMVGGSSRIPLVRSTIQNYFGKPPHIRLNPDQVVALGAARQAHLLNGGSRDYLLMDVVPLSLGIETVGGTFAKMIMKNASIPAKASELFSTSVDNQTGIELNIFQGEREFVKDCRRLGKFLLKGIPPMPAGLPKVEVNFFVDTNGLLTVSAKEQRSGVEQSIEIIPTHGLKKSEVNQMIRDSMEFAMDDFNLRNLVEFRAKAEAIEAGLEKIWDRAGEFLSPEEITAIAEHRKVLAEMAAGQNPMALKAAIDTMGDLTRELADSIMGDAARNALLDK